MQTYISILRGVNVSGSNKLPMALLKSLYEKLGFKNIITYIQSGNVVFLSNEKNAAKLSDKIKAAILKEFQLNVPVIIRTAEEMQSLINVNPFLKQKNIDEAKLHVTFLADDADKEHIKKINADQYIPDQFIIKNKEIYLYCPNGYGRTKLTNTFFENKLKLTATTRNWKTVNKLLRMADEKGD